MAEALKPCPFCGSVAGYGRTDDGGHYVECSWGACNATTNLRYTNTEDGQQKVAEQWNRRTPTPEAPIATPVSADVRGPGVPAQVDQLRPHA